VTATARVPSTLADSTPERLDAGHVEVTDNDDGGFGAVALRLDVPDVARRGLRFIRLGDPPGLSPITTVGSFVTVEEALVAADEVWASR
jgi:hypothetical protein